MLNLPTPIFNGYEIAAPVALPFLPSVRAIHIYGELKQGREPSTYQLNYYHSLAREDFPTQDRLDDCAYAYYLEVARIIDVRDFRLTDVTRETVQRYYRIETVVVPPLRGTSQRFLVLTGECAWDPEHGIQFVAKDAGVITTGLSDGIYQGGGWDDVLNSAKT